jgi:hypothetical protein
MAMQVSWFLKEEISRMIAETALCGAVIWNVPLCSSISFLHSLTESVTVL